MLAVPKSIRRMAGLILSNDIVQKILGAEYFIKNKLGRVRCAPIKMHIHTAVFVEQLLK